MRVTSVRNLERLATLQSHWERWQNDPNSDFAHFGLVCRLRPEVECPHVIVVERDGEPRAILAARLERTVFSPRIGYLEPVKLPATVLSVIYRGVLGDVDREVSDKIVAHVWSLLSAGEADAAAFHFLPESSPLLTALRERTSPLWCERTLAWNTHWRMAIPSVGSFLEKVRSKHRSWIKKKQRELESAHPDRITWRWLREFGDIPGLCRLLEEVAARTYQRELGAGFMDDEDHRQRFALFASRGQLRVQLLEIDAKAGAFWIGAVYAGVFHSWETGYLPELRPYEPGTLVFVRMMDALIQEGVRTFDFGLGDAFYKQRFGDESWREATVRLFAPTARGTALRASLGLVGSLDRMGRRLVAKFGVLDRLKTEWRRRLVRRANSER